MCCLPIHLVHLGRNSTLYSGMYTYMLKAQSEEKNMVSYCPVRVNPVKKIKKKIPTSKSPSKLRFRPRHWTKGPLVRPPSPTLGGQWPARGPARGRRRSGVNRKHRAKTRLSQYWRLSLPPPPKKIHRTNTPQKSRYSSRP